MNRPKVFLTGGDGGGWALDDDLALTRRALADRIEEVDLDTADVVHCVCWEGLFKLPPEKLQGKRIICHVPGEPFRYFATPAHRLLMPLVGCWVNRSTLAVEEFARIGVETTYVPYTTDVDVFRPLPADDPNVQAMRTQYGIPGDRYLIGSFHRDTEGGALDRPKLVKGPDIFVETVSRLHAQGHPVHVVLAGPRRHYVRAALAERGIPFTFVGDVQDGDDVKVNTLPRQTLNVLYNLLDVYVVSSRSEGGPQSVMEAAAAGCRIVSTPVALALDILRPACVYRSFLQAADILAQDIANGLLDGTVQPNRERVLARHTWTYAARRFSELYDRLDTIHVCHVDEPTARMCHGTTPNWMATTRDPKPCVSRWVDGAGREGFLDVLCNALREGGLTVDDNQLTDRHTVCLVDGYRFDMGAFLTAWRDHPLPVVHRLEAPCSCPRGFESEREVLAYAFNQQFATATIVPSAQAYQRIVERGYQPVAPVIVHETADPTLFNDVDRTTTEDGRLRVISIRTNPEAGCASDFADWMEQHLDWDRFACTSVNGDEKRDGRIRRMVVKAPAERADLLRHHDIYIASDGDPEQEAAVIEAMCCGLPVLYPIGGDLANRISHGGLGFTDRGNLLRQLDHAAANLDALRRLITPPRLEDAVSRYLSILRNAARLAPDERNGQTRKAVAAVAV